MKKVFLFLALLALTLTACETTNDYLVNFNSNGGSFVEAITTDGNSLITLPNDPVKEGYTFVGWYWDNNTFFDSFNESSLISRSISTNLTVYAKWELGEIKFTNDLEYEIIDNKIQILGLKDTNIQDLVIPETIDGLKVTSIQEDAFMFEYSLISITIPSSVIFIGEDAFNNASNLILINVDVSNTVYSSIEGVLYNKDITELIKYPEGKTSTSFVIPSTVQIIGRYAFSSVDTLSSIIIPSSVITIELFAFIHLDALSSITISSSVTSIDSLSFYKLKALTNINVDSANQTYSSIDGVLYNKEDKELVKYPDAKTNVSFSIPNGVTDIGSNAFTDISALTSITIPSSITRISSLSFRNLKALSNFNVDSANQTYSSIDGVLYNKDITEIVRYPEGKTNLTFTIPTSVLIIGPFAFENAITLTSIVIPNGVTTIEWSAFNNAKALTSINIPRSVTHIEFYAFFGLNSLTSIFIPSSVTNIDFAAFSNVSSLTIYAEVLTKPENWHIFWNIDNRPVVWGHQQD